jgi:hypothetical protein
MQGARALRLRGRLDLARPLDYPADTKGFLLGARMKIGLGVAAFLAAFGVPAVAAAQIPTSTSDIVPSTSGPSRSEVARADAVFRDLVECVIRYQPARTRNLLGTIPGTHEEATILDSFDSRMEQCYEFSRTGGRAMTFSSSLLRGGIAETYFRRDFPAGLSAEPALTAEAAAAWTQPRPSANQVTQMEMLHSMARCVTARQPAAVGTMLRAAPLSAEERAAMRTLQPDISACLDSGVEFAVSRQALRGLLAEAALHLAESRRGAAQSSRSASRTE